MMKRSLGMILVLAAWALGCGGPPRIDTSSEESATASLKQVRESLPEKMRPAFDEAVTTVVLSGYAENELRETVAGPERFGARALEPLNGMTAEEILTEARRIGAESEETRRGDRGPSGHARP
jgi:hypothetical protein